jgi:hypothetical protein
LITRAVKTDKLLLEAFSHRRTQVRVTYASLFNADCPQVALNRGFINERALFGRRCRAGSLFRIGVRRRSSFPLTSGASAFVQGAGSIFVNNAKSRSCDVVSPHGGIWRAVAALF